MRIRFGPSLEKQGLLESQRNLDSIEDMEAFRQQQESMLVFCNRLAEVCTVCDALGIIVEPAEA